MQDQACLSPLIHRKQENDLLRSGKKPFNLSASLKKIKPERSQEENSPQPMISNLKKIHESVEQDEFLTICPPTIKEEEEYSTPQFSGPTLSLKHRSFGGGPRSKLSLLRPKGLVT